MNGLQSEAQGGGGKAAAHVGAGARVSSGRPGRTMVRVGGVDERSGLHQRANHGDAAAAHCDVQQSFAVHNKISGFADDVLSCFGCLLATRVPWYHVGRCLN